MCGNTWYSIGLLMVESNVMLCAYTYTYTYTHTHPHPQTYTPEKRIKSNQCEFVKYAYKSKRTDRYVHIVSSVLPLDFPYIIHTHSIQIVLHKSFYLSVSLSLSFTFCPISTTHHIKFTLGTNTLKKTRYNKCIV